MYALNLALQLLVSLLLVNTITGGAAQPDGLLDQNLHPLSGGTLQRRGTTAPQPGATYAVSEYQKLAKIVMPSFFQSESLDVWLVRVGPGIGWTRSGNPSRTPCLAIFRDPAASQPIWVAGVVKSTDGKVHVRLGAPYNQDMMLTTPPPGQVNYLWKN
ncbi:hypothetical protein THASP1DRAFT_30446 [Thamnocephalis sphaerospora]|uniref:Secreted protein n=1 Tax=Thamnocephalis sphaerospora TaxID=78915 RepID=A0A4P9XR03_9FUNG|nr:hypothetical protein THASP1DRAFT_30446 [Thamnocephalis sphaerospora]|eukprot:RKP07740.1 hypothetical protein THASP1DRAFT_30446 [Thamnocephalis sphaerospora]